MHDPSKESIVPKSQEFIDANDTETPTTPLHSDSSMVGVGGYPK